MGQEHRENKENPIGRISSVDNLTGIPIVTSEYMPKGEIWMVNNETVLVGPYNDLVWETTLARILAEQRKIGSNYIKAIIKNLEETLWPPVKNK